MGLNNDNDGDLWWADDTLNPQTLTINCSATHSRSNPNIQQACAMLQELEWADFIEAVAADIFGACNERFSSARDVRFGNQGSVAINYIDGTWYDFEEERGGGVMDLIQIYRDIEDPAAIRAYAEECLEKFESGPPPRSNGSNGASAPRQQTELEASYVYHDAAGRVAFEVLRFIYPIAGGGYVVDADGKRKKGFMQRRPSGEPDEQHALGAQRRRVYAQGSRRCLGHLQARSLRCRPDRQGAQEIFPTSAPIVPYRLPELLISMAAGKPTYLAEGGEEGRSADLNGLRRHLLRRRREEVAARTHRLFSRVPTSCSSRTTIRPARRTSTLSREACCPGSSG